MFYCRLDDVITMVNIRIETPFIITSFDDGSELIADMREQHGQYELASSMGCSVQEMNATHDPFHSLVCEAIGLRCSPSLWCVANGLPSTELSGLEEDAILAVQKFYVAAIKEGWGKN